MSLRINEFNPTHSSYTIILLVWYVCCLANNGNLNYARKNSLKIAIDESFSPLYSSGRLMDKTTTTLFNDFFLLWIVLLSKNKYVCCQNNVKF